MPTFDITADVEEQATPAVGSDGAGAVLVTYAQREDEPPYYTRERVMARFVSLKDPDSGPDAGVAEPDAGVEPDADIVEPDSGVVEPDAGVNPDHGDDGCLQVGSGSSGSTTTVLVVLSMLVALRRRRVRPTAHRP